MSLPRVQSAAVTGAPDSPPARRVQHPGWRDPRLAVGIVIVAVSVLFGARLLASADDSVSVYSVRRDLSAGERVGTADVVTVDIRFADSAEADRYLAASTPIPADAVLLRSVGAGELLPRAALGRPAEVALTEVPLAVPAESVPQTLRAGSMVDVWVTPAAAGRGAGQEPEPDAERVLTGVVVIALPESGSGLGPASVRQVIVGVDTGQEARLAGALASMSRGTTVLTRRADR